MTSQILHDARNYEKLSEKKILQKERPGFHLVPRVGWMNDPNGFSYYDGMYHLFYQYYPYALNWGPTHWGHAVTEDFLHWKYLPVALAPDESYDKNGCFSGSAIELPNGKHLLMYTGVAGGNEKEKGIQTQCVAIGNGTDYEKHPANPVIDASQLPIGASKHDFRDPKLWKCPDGSYRCVVGNRSTDGSGQILLFSSHDCIHWAFEKILAANKNRFGKMWECPDFFELNGKQILLTSPQDMIPKNLEYHNGNGTLCLIGAFDEETGDFVEEYNQSIDYGIDFYAPQTILSQDGRRIMIGWMQNWDTCNIHSSNHPWFGQMTIPRELCLKNNRLIQKPIRELVKLRTNKVIYEHIKFTKTVHLEEINGRLIDLELVIRPGDTCNLYREFAVYFAQNETFHTIISFEPSKNILKIDRRFSGSRRAIIHQRSCHVESENGNIKLRLILDRFSAEVFVNDGEYALTATIYTEQTADEISFFADGSVIMDVTKYELQP